METFLRRKAFDGPSPGVIQTGGTNDRNANALTFVGGDQEWTLYLEEK